jgi:hypothetical protein
MIPCGDDGCVDPQSDTMHCGGCSPCPSNLPVCSLGNCQACENGFTNCSGSCFNLKYDFEHCGDCNKECAVNQACINGMCIGGN